LANISLRLYIAGIAVVSQKAQENLQRLCECFGFPIDVAIIDVLLKPQLADEARILATPTLLYEHPARSKRIIGDLSDIDKIVEFLGLQRGDNDEQR
jgi:circadian clock protein KaiB